MSEKTQISKLTRAESKLLNNIEKSIISLQKEGCFPKAFKMPLGLQFELTAECNMRCEHCYNRSGDPDKKTTMKVSDWINLANQIVEKGGVFQCIISGGEPTLLGDSLFPIMDILHENNTGFVFLSNGFLLDNAFIQKLCKYYLYWVQISIDGSDSSYHDAFRHKKGSWEKAVQAAFTVAHNGLPLKIASSVMPENLMKMHEMAELAYGLGASSIIFGPVMVSGRANGNAKLFLDADMLKLFNKNMKELEEKYHGKMIIQYSSSDYYQLKYNSIYPMQTAIIRPNGDVRLDCTAPFVIGNVLNEPIDQIWERSGNAWKDVTVQNYIQDIENGCQHITNHVDHDLYLK